MCVCVCAYMCVSRMIFSSLMPFAPTFLFLLLHWFFHSPSLPYPIFAGFLLPRLRNSGGSLGVGRRHRCRCIAMDCFLLCHGSHSCCWIGRCPFFSSRAFLMQMFLCGCESFLRFYSQSSCPAALLRGHKHALWTSFVVLCALLCNNGCV
jgi:hypothetical protein